MDILQSIGAELNMYSQELAQNSFEGANFRFFEGQNFDFCAFL